MLKKLRQAIVCSVVLAQCSNGVVLSNPDIFLAPRMPSGSCSIFSLETLNLKGVFFQHLDYPLEARRLASAQAQDQRRAIATGNETQAARLTAAALHQMDNALLRHDEADIESLRRRLTAIYTRKSPPQEMHHFTHVLHALWPLIYSLPLAKLYDLTPYDLFLEVWPVSYKRIMIFVDIHRNSIANREIAPLVLESQILETYLQLLRLMIYATLETFRNQLAEHQSRPWSMAQANTAAKNVVLAAHAQHNIEAQLNNRAIATGSSKGPIEKFPLVNPKAALPASLRMDISLWSEAYSARTVVEEMRRAQVSIPVLIHVQDGFPDSPQLTRLGKLFKSVPNIRIARTEEVTNAELGEPLRILFSSMAHNPSHQITGIWELPTEKLKTWTDPVSAEDIHRMASDLALRQGEHVFVIGSANTKEADDIMALIIRLKQATQNLRILLVPRWTGQINFWQTKAKNRGILLDIRRMGRNHMPEMQLPLSSSVVLFDTEGELRTAYGLADVALIGNTFRTDGTGHNITEPVIQGAYVLFGERVDQNKVLAAYVLRKNAGKRLRNMREAFEFVLSSLDGTIAAEHKRIAAAAAAGIREEIVLPVICEFLSGLQPARAMSVRAGVSSSPLMRMSS